MTPERFRRVCAVLDRRQPDLAVIMDEVNKPHNVSAILRTCDAVGIPKVVSIAPSKAVRVYKKNAASAMRWVEMQTRETVQDAIAEMRAQGMQIIAAHWSDRAVDFRAADYTRPTCLVAGSEKFGVSAAAAALADVHVYVPMLGMVQSLNVSVASALILYEAERQRQLSGAYARPRLSEAERQRLMLEWLYPRLANYCRARGWPYPLLDDAGHLLASEQDWPRELFAAQAGDDEDE